MPLGLLFGPVACGDSDPPNLVRKTIGPSGGLISSHDDVLSIVLLPGALSGDVDIEIFPSDEPPPIFGLTYRVRPDIDLMFDAEVTYRRVLPSNPNAGVIGAIKLDTYTDEMGHWEPLPRLTVNPDQESVIAVDDQLSLYYGLVEAPNAPPLPGDDDNGDDNNDDTPTPTDDDGPIATSGMTTDDGGMTDGTTMSADSATDDGPPPGETTNTTTPPPGTDSGGDDMGMEVDDGPKVMPICSDGMPQAGELCLVAGMTFATGLGPADVGLAEVTGDANLDVVTLDLDALEIGVLPGNGDGTFEATAAAGAVAGTPVKMLVEDFTGEGAADVAVLDTAADSVSLLAGDGAGGFAAAVDTVVGTAVVDFNSANYTADGARDIAVLGATAPDLQLWFGDATGEFQPGAYTMVNAGLDAVIGTGHFNLNFDANEDAMAVGAGGYQAWAANATATMFGGQIAGGFGPGGTFVEIAVGDINEDGQPDVAAIDAAGNALIVGLSTGAPATFMFGPPFAVGTTPSDLVLADMDGDGDLDAVVCNAGSNDLTVLAWDNGTLYTEAFTAAAGTAPTAVAVGQLDDDGVPDIVVSSATDDQVAVFLSDP